MIQQNASQANLSETSLNKGSLNKGSLNKGGPHSNSPKAVVVHRGARDAYQVARALSEAGLLEALVTDLYWAAGSAWARSLFRVLPHGFQSALLQRNEPHLPGSEVQLCAFSGLTSFLLDKLPRVPFSWRRRATRWADASLGATAGKLAQTRQSTLLAYSYYGYHAFSQFHAPGILFQLHPHPASVRRILQTELEAHPDCAASLRKEWELALPEEEFERLLAETRMAAHFLAASSFTRQTLVENGALYPSVTVAPYGVDTAKFHPARFAGSSNSRQPSSTLRLLFVGTINQRKGIKYLLESLRLLRSKNIHLTVCGRVVDNLDIFKPYLSQVDVRPSVSSAELLTAYQQSDLFVFPSVAEGFAQVLLESLACGLPILSTTHTAAPDLIDHGVQGFIVEPRRPDLLAERIDWAASHPGQLSEMSIAARERAEQFTWRRFRAQIADTVLEFHAAQENRKEALANYV